jgi:hypothetical protein
LTEISNNPGSYFSPALCAIPNVLTEQLENRILRKVKYCGGYGANISEEICDSFFRINNVILNINAADSS